MTSKFIPNYMIRPMPDSDKVNLRVINPDDPNDYVSLVKDGIDGACYEIIEAHNSQIGDPNFFYEWDDAVVFYEEEELSRFNDEYGEDDDNFSGYEDTDEDW